jgi:hypothetical protein
MAELTELIQMLVDVCCYQFQLSLYKLPLWLSTTNVSWIALTILESESPGSRPWTFRMMILHLKHGQASKKSHALCLSSSSYSRLSQARILLFIAIMDMFQIWCYKEKDVYYLFLITLPASTFPTNALIPSWLSGDRICLKNSYSCTKRGAQVLRQ